MIKFISADDVLPLRSLVLRSGAPLDSCRMDVDQLETTFHMGYYEDRQLVCILTCQLEDLEEYNDIGYRLRGMATHPDFTKKGIGSQLLTAAIDHLIHELKADYLWCNARRVAYSFYLNLGFEILSEEFEIPVIGPHKVMYLGLG